MYITFNNIKYRIDFKHNRVCPINHCDIESNLLYRGYKSHNTFYRNTKIYVDGQWMDVETKNNRTLLSKYIEDEQHYEQIYAGCGTCHPKDVFDKKIGRKKALTELLKNTEKSFNRLVWETYKQSFKYKAKA